MIFAFQVLTKPDFPNRFSIIKWYHKQDAVVPYHKCKYCVEISDDKV